MYKLIAMDMDGTLLNNKKELTAETIKVLKQAKKQGIYPVLATGRPLQGIRNYLQQLDLAGAEDYVVTFSGARLSTSDGLNVLYSANIVGADLRKIYELAQQHQLNLHAFDQHGCIAPRSSKYTDLEIRLNNLELRLCDFAKMAIDEPIIKVLLADEPDLLNQLHQKLNSEWFENYNILRSAPFFLEFLRKDVDKWSAIQCLANHLGIKNDEIMCIGDAGNDKSMICNAGLGVAMQNAFDEVKECADFVTLSNEEDGVAYAIKKFVI